MAANDATTIPNTGMNAGMTHESQRPDDSTKSTIVFRPLGWNDLGTVTELFDRTWPQDVDELGPDMSRLISRYFVLHYLKPTTFANGAFTADGTLAGVTFIRVAGEAPQLDEIEVGEEMKALERRICADSKAVKHMAALKSGFSVEIDLEREGMPTKPRWVRWHCSSSLPMCVATVWAASGGAACSSISPHGTCPHSICTPIPTAT